MLRPDQFQATVTLSTVYVDRLRTWASVQRTLSEAERLLTKCSGDIIPDSDDMEELYECIRELQDIGPALDHLHQAMRTEIWKADHAAEQNKATEELLKNHARQQVEGLPQYEGHFDEYVLVRIKDSFSTKMGMAFRKDEYAIAEPRRKKCLVHNDHAIVWSEINKVATSVPKYLVEYLPTKKAGV